MPISPSKIAGKMPKDFTVVFIKIDMGFRVPMLLQKYMMSLYSHIILLFIRYRK